MATEQKINMDQASGGCQTVKFNGNTVKKIILDGKTIWQHKTRKVSSYTQGSWTVQNYESDYPYEVVTYEDGYSMATNNIGGCFYTSYDFNSSKGIAPSGSLVIDRRNFSANTWYYRNAWNDNTYQDWIQRIKFSSGAFSNGLLGGTTEGGSWVNGHDESESGYYWLVDWSNITVETIDCTKNYTWVVD